MIKLISENFDEDLNKWVYKINSGEGFPIYYIYLDPIHNESEFSRRTRALKKFGEYKRT